MDSSDNCTLGISICRFQGGRLQELGWCWIKMCQSLMIKRLELEKSFSNSNFKVSKEIDFKKKITILYGANGTGKSLTIKILSGLINSNSKVEYTNKEYYNSYLDFLKDNVYVFLDEVIFDFEYVKLKDVLRVYNIKKDDLENYFMKEYENAFIKDLSHGNRKKLAFIIGLKSSKQVLLLDELSNGVDKYSKKQIAKDLKNTNKQIIFSSHDEELLKLLDDYDCINY